MDLDNICINLQAYKLFPASNLKILKLGAFLIDEGRSMKKQNLLNPSRESVALKVCAMRRMRNVTLKTLTLNHRKKLLLPLR